MIDNTRLADHLRSITISPDLSIFRAVEKLNDAHKRILLIADADARLLGVVTDSNIRRGILDRIDFNLPIRELMVTKPFVVSPDVSDRDVLSVMERTQCYQIPVIDKDDHIVGIRYVNELLEVSSEQQDRVAVIMAGGLGSRLMPLTENTPKPLIPVGDRPILFTVLDQLLAAGFTKIYVTLNYQGDQIVSAIEAESNYRDYVSYIREDRPLGTAGALQLIDEIPEGPFLVINGDVLTKVALQELTQFHERERNLITMALNERKFEVPYGVVELDNTRVTGLREKPSMPVLINAGVYVVEPIVLSRIPHDTRWNMTDVIDDLLAAQMRVGGFPIHEYWIDIGEPGQLRKAEDDFSEHFRGSAGQNK
jgi:dTDP-glucose pyrophosphorylase